MAASSGNAPAVQVIQHEESVPWVFETLRDMIDDNIATGGWEHGRHDRIQERMLWPKGGNVGHGLHPAARQSAPAHDRITPTRLLNGKTGAVEESMGRKLPYTTISHVWTITAGKDWPSFASQLWEKYGIQYIWVDSLCIDQSSIDDKANEIPRMAEYYAGAEMNLIPMPAPGLRKGLDDWLESGATAAAVDPLLWLLRNLLEDGYFRRVWTMQETALACCTHLDTPDGLIYGWEIDEALRRACGIPSKPRNPEDPPTFNAKTPLSSETEVGQLDLRVVLFDNRHVRRLLSSQAWIARNRKPLALVWRQAKNRQCTVAKDAFWGMMAMVEGGDKLSSTYDQPIEQVLGEMVERGFLGLEILCAPKTMPEHSWVPALPFEVPGMGAECNIGEAQRKVRLVDRRLVVRAKEVLVTGVGGAYEIRIREKSNKHEMLMMTEGVNLGGQHPGQRHWLILLEGTESHTAFVLISDGNDAGFIVHKVGAIQCGVELPPAEVQWALDGQEEIHVGESTSLNSASAT
ncbi:hypothetical protein CkaCkLH20_04196 [Colletotrichum karsti]|uniref:Heterokaryon incompatibility domain-containing protein n=1 Tax=Colletotrichum karsti TaxID=1095194 RepID=A0A9P6LLU1_9PEZI|nr:uncharacterized protein CkaCkLH20_04196 [Colletotrichum karsti]KAF9878158.1 hypothetical protein CkaCkLH20_04196 [Colletotrichum karsti]